jgi:mannosyltransferase OCH1-like enzyme
MIPKKIHYCWFGGGPLTPLASKCIESWKKFCPYYEIVEWNEKNFDINLNAYVAEAYTNKKWAFVSDVARLWALVSDGGIYMDTDCELIKPLDCFLNNEAFIGFETDKFLQTALMGGAQGQELYSQLLDDYNNRHFLIDNGKLDTTTNVHIITNTMIRHGLVLNNAEQTVRGLSVYPSDFFCPLDGQTNTLNITNNTHAIHWFDGSWLTNTEKKEYLLVTKYRKRFGKVVGSILYTFVAIVTFRKSGIQKLIDKFNK